MKDAAAIENMVAGVRAAAARTVDVKTFGVADGLRVPEATSDYQPSAAVTAISTSSGRSIDDASRAIDATRPG